MALRIRLIDRFAANGGGSGLRSIRTNGSSNRRRGARSELPQEIGRSGEFRRAENQFRNRITADGSSGFKAEPGRYHPLCRARLPVGAPHFDLSRLEEARQAARKAIC
jgi:hypothetical protein